EQQEIVHVVARELRIETVLRRRRESLFELPRFGHRLPSIPSATLPGRCGSGRWLRARRGKRRHWSCRGAAIVRLGRELDRHARLDRRSRIAELGLRHVILAQTRASNAKLVGATRSTERLAGENGPRITERAPAHGNLALRQRQRHCLVLWMP